MYTCANRKRFQLGNNMSMMKKYYLPSFAFSTVYIRAYRIHGSKAVFEITSIFPWDACGTPTVKSGSLYPKLQSQPIGLRKIFIYYLFFQADQSDCTKSVSISNRFASSEERSLPNLSRWSFPTRGLGWRLVNQRNPSGYWQVTKGDLSQIISFLHDSFLFRSSFFIRF